eukprot:TRINITY_DN10097_c0_g2_i4.p1 TRINITY_DN10097_c0_g2~~TRINITY_DN10097_c0_g2_i4.p1  ORF type:complete len:293 (+),score=72.61 TRINITY_DN10097_c0_g2_i4:40-879(+)
MHHHRRSPYPMLPVPVALEIVLENILPGSPIEVPLESSLGLVLSDEIISEEPMPPFPASIMDGYAVQAKDCPGNLTVLGLASAGFVSPMKVGEGKIIQITTGSPIPEGADAVVMVEETELVEKLEDGTQIVKINTSALPGQNIRTVGCDIQLGQVIVGAGEVIGPAEIGLLAGAGVTRVMVHRPPVVGILSTGDELVEPSIKPKNGQIRDSNRSMLLSAMSSECSNIPALDLGIAPDSLPNLEKLFLDSLSRVDVLITSGGVSMGELDLLKPFLEKYGV